MVGKRLVAVGVPAVSTVTHRQSQRLAALGLTPTYPGMVCVPCGLAPGPCLTYADLISETTDVYACCLHGANWYRADTVLPAPAYVSGDGEGGALEWCERGHGWRWKRIAEGWWGESGSSVFDREDTGRVESASELLDAVLDAIEAAQAAKESR